MRKSLITGCGFKIEIERLTDPVMTEDMCFDDEWPHDCFATKNLSALVAQRCLPEAPSVLIVLILGFEISIYKTAYHIIVSAQARGLGKADSIHLPA